MREGDCARLSGERIGKWSSEGINLVVIYPLPNGHATINRRSLAQCKMVSSKSLSRGFPFPLVPPSWLIGQEVLPDLAPRVRVVCGPVDIARPALAVFPLLPRERATISIVVSSPPAIYVFLSEVYTCLTVCETIPTGVPTDWQICPSGLVCH